MSATISGTNTPREQRATRGTLIAGLMQAVCALAILFLPIMPAPCTATGMGEAICPRLPYLQMEGSFVGYGYLLLMIGIGIGAVVLASDRFTEYACVFRWLSVLLSISVVVLGAWSVGFLFLPGGVLMLFTALRCFRSKNGEPHSRGTSRLA